MTIDIHPSVQTPALLKNVWPVTAAGQHLHLLHVNAQALLDPLEAVCVQGGGAKEERGSQVGGARRAATSTTLVSMAGNPIESQDLPPYN